MQPSIDIELRYSAEDEVVDMGVFAPSVMLGVQEAENMINEFLRILDGFGRETRKAPVRTCGVAGAQRVH